MSPVRGRRGIPGCASDGFAVAPALSAPLRSDWSGDSATMTTTDRGQTAYRVFTTNPGLEKVVRGEFRQRCYNADTLRATYDAAIDTVRGRVVAHAPSSIMDRIAPAMRSIHHILRPVYRFRLASGEGSDRIAAEIAALTIPEMVAAGSFRITSNRRGEHVFSSQDVMRAAGTAVNSRWGTPVDLKNYAVELRVDVIDDLCSVDVRYSRAPLSNRHPRTQTHPAALRANIAFAALRLAQLDGARRLLDPFCGSGTILLEAGAVWPDLDLIGCDWNERAATGAHANLVAASLAHRSQVMHRDSLAGLAELGPCDAIVTNPPFGRKLSRSMNFPNFYRRLFETMAPLLGRGARLVFLADRGGAVNRGLRAAGGFRARRERLLQMSGVWPRIYVFERV